MTLLSQIKWFGNLSINLFFIFILLSLFADGVILANWNWNLYYDLLFARIQGPLLYLNHSSVMAMLTGITIVRIILSKFTMIKEWMTAMLAVAAIHEFALAIADFSIGGFTFVGVTMSPRYAIYLGSFLILAAIICKPWQKKALVIVAIGITILFVSQVIGQYPNTSGSSVIGFAPTANFYNPRTNFWEVFNWFLPCTALLLPKKYLDAISINSLKRTIDGWQELPP